MNLKAFAKSNINILVVEDEEIARENLKQILEKKFKSVTLAENGLEAKEKYANGVFNIVLTDIKMPKMNGIELAKYIKEVDYNQHIMVLSAHNDSDKLIELINIGIDKFILKPIDPKILLDTIFNIIKTIYLETLISEYQKKLKEKIENLEKEQRFNLVQKAIIVFDTKESNLDYEWFKPSVREEKTPILLQSVLFLDESISDIKDMIDYLDSMIPSVMSDKRKSLINFINELEKIIKLVTNTTFKIDLFLKIEIIFKNFINEMRENIDVILEKDVELLVAFLEAVPKNLDNWLKSLTQKGIYSRNEMFESDAIVVSFNQILNILIKKDGDIEGIVEFF